MHTCRRFTVTGKVQGVNFRAATVDAARQLGVTGWVRNLADGSVELVACGEDALLQDLEEWLWQGSPSARVDAVETTDAAFEKFKDFAIR